MAFTREHYETIAKVIRNASLQVDSYAEELHTGSTQVLDKAQLIDDLLSVFKSDNARFDESKFIDACYPK